MKDLEAKVIKHLRDRAWDTVKPGDLAKSIMIEGAELLEKFQWENPSLQETKTKKAKLKEIADELADVFIYSLELSVLLGFDTDKIIRSKLARVQKKYPATLMRKQTGEPGTSSVYSKIKQAHRKSK